MQFCKKRSKKLNKIKTITPNIVSENILKIKDLFPNCVIETKDKNDKITLKIDFETLKQELSDDIIGENQEKYELTWPGKNKSILLANQPTDNTLRPCKDESVNWDSTQNLYIEGDNLEVLKILRSTYSHKVKLIYIDPPYNTGKDFIYKDNYKKSKKEYLRETKQIDEERNHLVKNKETNGRFHTDWLNMMYPRLKLARDFLTDDGVIFISIDDHEVHNIKNICNEVFGEENFVGQMIHQRAKGGGQAKHIVRGHDYILIYAKQLSSELTLKKKKIVQQKTYEINGKTCIKDDDVIRKAFGKYDKNLNDRRCFYEELLKYKGINKKNEVDRKIESGELFLEKNKFGMHTICKYIPLDNASSKLYSIITVMSKEGKSELENINLPYFDYPKPINLIKQLVSAATFDSKDSIVLDFFSGSATTAHAVMQLNAEDGGNRKFIMVQLPESCNEKSEAFKAGYKNICEIGKERIRRAGKKIIEKTGKTDLDVGFRVLKLESTK